MSFFFRLEQQQRAAAAAAALLQDLAHHLCARQLLGMATRMAREAATKNNAANEKILAALMNENDNKSCAECLSKGKNLRNFFFIVFGIFYEYIHT